MRECSPPKTSQVSCVTCHVSRVMCQVSRVTYLMSHVTYFFLQGGEAYWWRVGYQRGLPRLVFLLIAPLLSIYNLKRLKVQNPA